jgi:hypothetical protein
MADHVSSFFMLIPGPWREPAAVARALAERGISDERSETKLPRPGSFRVEVVEDNRLAAGFAWGRQGPLADEVLARVAVCSRAALIEFRGRLNEHAPRVAKLGRALRDAGGAAVRMEASGAASSWELWLERLESGEPFRIYESAVLQVRGDDDVMFTCGMHQFDLADAQIAMHDPQEALAWLDTFSVYQLAEQPALASGHAFRPHADTERRSFDRWPDHRHHADDGRHNPFGIWRFRGPAASGVQATRLVPTLIPSLVSVLTAAERSSGRRLTRREVEEIVANSPAIAMEPRDALTLERSRGYADIEPDLAWEQWQIVRGAT